MMWLLVVFLKNKDNTQPMQTISVNILEKPIQQENIEWYVVECDNGRRLKLRSFQSNHLIITVDDVSVLSYKGKTIQSFQ